jgi:hypothetical protein
MSDGAPKGSKPFLRRVGPAEVEIGPQPKEGEEPRGVLFHGPHAERVAVVHEHMTTHGEQWAATYLMGVVDGLKLRGDMDMQQLTEHLKRREAELLRRGKAAGT